MIRRNNPVPALARGAVCGALAVIAACSTSDDGAPAADSAQWLVEITEEAGLAFTHDAGATGALDLPEIVGAGGALFDADGDGDLDVYLVNGGGQTDLLKSNRLFIQIPGGRFIDDTDASGLGDTGYGMGVAIGDYDNDGDRDVYVTNLGIDKLYRNDGAGHFTDVTAAAGIVVPGWSASAAFVDYDLDGFLDLYVCQYVQYDPTRKCFDAAGRPDYCGPKEFVPASDVLLHNDGNGTFTDVSAGAGIRSAAGAGLGVVAEDFDLDGWPDIYVANDGYANHLWMNRGDGTFRDEAIVQGVAYNLHGQAEAGMGVIAADFDNDGDLDLFLTHLAVETNTLYRNLGPGAGFVDATGQTGGGASSMPFTGFGTVAFDIELDGDLDVAVANGRVARGPPHADTVMVSPWDRYAEPNLFYMGDRGRLVPLVEPVRDFTDRVEISRGLAVGDLDGDGDLDLLVTGTEGPARLYRNDAPRRGNWLAIRAVDSQLNRDAIGALVTVRLQGASQIRTISGGFSYLSASPPVAHFGLGTAASVDGVEVRWPDGLRERFHVDGVDKSVTLLRSTGERMP